MKKILIVLSFVFVLTGSLIADNFNFERKLK